MAFRQNTGRAYTVFLPKAASTVFTIGDLVYANGTGEIIPADATSGHHLGVIQKSVAATDDDYASTTAVPVLFPCDATTWLVSVGTGTADSDDIGNFIDLADAANVDVTASAKDAVLVTGVISGTEVEVIINNMASHDTTSTT